MFHLFVSNVQKNNAVLWQWMSTEPLGFWLCLKKSFVNNSNHCIWPVIFWCLCMQEPLFDVSQSSLKNITHFISESLVTVSKTAVYTANWAIDSWLQNVHNVLFFITDFTLIQDYLSFNELDSLQKFCFKISVISLSHGYILIFFLFLSRPTEVSVCWVTLRLTAHCPAAGSKE